VEPREFQGSRAITVTIASHPELRRDGEESSLDPRPAAQQPFVVPVVQQDITQTHQQKMLEQMREKTEQMLASKTQPVKFQQGT
jgi:hypothetical protein